MTETTLIGRLWDRETVCTHALRLEAAAALLKAEARIAEVEKERDAARAALERAVADMKAARDLQSHGASDRTYIDWVRSNINEAIFRARAALSPDRQTEDR